MFFRRNMSSNVSYQQLKEYAIFRELSKYNDVLILKEILPMVVKRISPENAKEQHLTKNNKMMLIAEENIEGCIEAGNIVDMVTLKDIKSMRSCGNVGGGGVGSYKTMKSIFYNKDGKDLKGDQNCGDESRENIQPKPSSPLKAQKSNNQTTTLGVPNSNTNTKMKFLLIETKIYNILRYLFFKEIDCFEHFKSFEKLNFFYRCDLPIYSFGGYVYRKGDMVSKIYYLVRGEIQITKCVDEKEINICKLYEGTFFGAYEFQENSIRRILNAQSYSNETIVLEISLDMVGEIFTKDEEEIIRRILELGSERQKVLEVYDGCNCGDVRNSSQSKKSNKKMTAPYSKTHSSFIKAFDFHRRVLRFKEAQNINKVEPVFNKFVENKSLLFKINDSNRKQHENGASECSERKRNNNKVMISNFHKSEEMMRCYERLNKHRLESLGTGSKNKKKEKVCDRASTIGRENCGPCNSAIGDGASLLTDRLKAKYSQNRRRHFAQFEGKEQSNHHLTIRVD